MTSSGRKGGSKVFRVSAEEGALHHVVLRGRLLGHLKTNTKKSQFQGVIISPGAMTTCIMSTVCIVPLLMSFTTKVAKGYF